MMNKIIKYLKNGDLIYATLGWLLKKEQTKKSFSKEKDVEFIQRKSSMKEEKLLIILAGFQPYYWDVLFEKTYNSIKDENMDVCVCIPGVDEESKQKLYSICDKYGFSSAYYTQDRLAALQNYTIKKFNSSKYIFKIDEDIVINKNFVSGLMNGLEFSKTTRNRYGLVVPLINVNVFSYIPFLQSLNKLDEYDRRFGKAMFWDANIQHNPEVAVFLWNLLGTLSFDEFAAKIEEINKGKYIQCPQRYSIGAILFTRDLWEKCGYFKVAKIGQLGYEEEQLCKYLLDNAYYICCCMDTFVGHLGYGRQKDACKEYFDKNIDKFVEV